MGDDAEYYIEQQEQDALFKQVSEHGVLDLNTKPLLCWADGVAYEDEIWSWEPLDRIVGDFSTLHRDRQIGSDCFLATSVPIIGDGKDSDAEYSPSRSMISPDVKFIGDLKFYIASSEADATYEVIVLSRGDAEPLRAEVIEQKSSAKTLRYKMLAEMLEEMVSLIRADSVMRLFLQENCENQHYGFPAIRAW